MEVPGKLGNRDSTLGLIPCDKNGLREQARDSTLVCLTCDRNGLRKPPYGFCQDCEEHLCKTCYKRHRRPGPLGTHVLLDKESMPKTQIFVPEIPDDRKDLCKQHQDRPQEFYCKYHKSLVCNCKMDYIPDVSGDMSEEISRMFERMETLMKECTSNIENAILCTQKLEQSYFEVLEDIKLFRKEINDCLDEMQATIIREGDAIKQDALHKQETIKNTCVEITEELKRSKLLLNTLIEENQQNKLFVEIKNAEELMSILTDKEKQIIPNKTIVGLKFTQNTSILDRLKTEKNFGQFTTYPEPSSNGAIDLHYTSKINLKSISDKKKCSITGIVMIAPLKMIAADENNKVIKLIDVEKFSIEKEIRVSSSPSDVINLSENELAVNLRDEKCIQFISYTEKGLSLSHRITVGETVDELGYSQNKFVVTCLGSRKIMILNIEGDILYVLDPTGLFNGPMKVLISNDEKSLFIMDTDMRKKNKVVKIDWKGNVTDVFEESGYNDPFGMLQLEDETILICFRDSNKILRLSTSLKRCQIIALQDKTLCIPKALTYCDKDHKLYVCCSPNRGKLKADVVKVYNVKWFN